MTTEKRVTAQFVSFINSCKSLRDEVNFGSVFLKAYFEEISAPRVKLNVRRCLKLFFLLVWCRLTSKIVSPHDQIDSEIKFCISGFIVNVVLYVSTVKFKSFATLTGLVTATLLVVLVVHVVIWEGDGDVNEVYNLSLFSPLFPYGLLAWTVTSVDMKVLLPPYFGFLNKGLADIQSRLTTYFYFSTTKDVQHKMQSTIQHAYRLQLPIDSSLLDNMMLNIDYKNKFKTVVYGFVFMIMFCFVIVIYVHFINKLRRLSSFMKLSQNVHAKQSIGENENERMKWIAAIMPSSIIPEYMAFINKQERNPTEMEMAVFSKPYNNVSILFADIVGFTSMSSNKTAPQVVMILNDLFNRFDSECVKLNCEKIGTLGDCYYCVSGCPDRRRDHAANCVFMGLKMCTMIIDFNKEYGESVNMRVGVHTGRVNAAVIGKQRFKFDVYSYAVLIANGMESSGEAGRVHISEDTYHEVENLFQFERGEDFEMQVEKQVGIQGMVLSTVAIPTYFVVDTGGGQVEQNTMPEVEQNLQQGGVLEVDYIEDISEDVVDSWEMTRSREDSHVEMSMHSTIDGGKKEGEERGEDELMEWDRQLIQALRNDPENMTEYFRRPPIHPFFLTFQTAEHEKEFQNQFVNNSKDGLRFLAPNYASFFDGILSVIFNALYTFGLFHNFPTITPEGKFQLVILNALGGLFFVLLALVTFTELGVESRFLRKINTYTMRNIHGMIACNVPFVALFCAYHCASLTHSKDFMYNQPFYIAAMMSFLPVITFHSCSSIVHFGTTLLKFIIIVMFYSFDPACRMNYKVKGSCSYWTNKKECSPCQKIWFSKEWGHNPSTMLISLMGEFLCMVVAVVFITRQNEEIFRLCYFVTKEANCRLKEAEDQSRRAEQLLYNIIPKYVIDQINQKKGGKVNYAVAVPIVAVTFACISNFFSSYYREDYKGGESALALLNKIISTFDDALLQPHYKDVEKIKTINDCYVLAAGLNVAEIKRNLDDMEHTHALLDYCIEMLTMIEDFNDMWIIGPNRFILKIGYNFGPVTAGIIGTTKPMFDIWGDTVNVSSRMYSNGTPGNIQVSKTIAKKLKHKYHFKKRGEIFLKGKGMVMTYLVVGSIDTGVRLATTSMLVPGKR